MTLQDKVKTLKHCTTNTECEGCPAFIIKDGDRRCTLPGSTEDLADSIIRELTEPATREELWRLNLANLTAGAYGDTKDPATLARYWSDQTAADSPGALENFRFFENLVTKTRPKTVEERVAEIKQVMELCEQVGKKHQQHEGDEHHAT